MGLKKYFKPQRSHRTVLGESRPIPYFSRDHWSPFLLLMYGSHGPLTRVTQVWCPSLHLVRILLPLRNHFPCVFWHVGFFLRRRIFFFGLDRSVKERGERGTKKDNFFLRQFFFFTTVRYVWWIDHTTVRVTHVWSPVGSLVSLTGHVYDWGNRDTTRVSTCTTVGHPLDTTEVEEVDLQVFQLVGFIPNFLGLHWVEHFGSLTD